MRKIKQQLGSMCGPEPLRIWVAVVEGAEAFKHLGRMAGVRIAGQGWQVDDTIPADKAQSSDEAVVVALREVLRNVPTGTRKIHVFTRETGTLHAFQAPNFPRWARAKHRSPIWLPLADEVGAVEITASRPDAGDPDWNILAVLEGEARRVARRLPTPNPGDPIEEYAPPFDFDAARKRAMERDRDP